MQQGRPQQLRNRLGIAARAPAEDSEVGGLIRLAIRQAAPKTEAVGTCRNWPSKAAVRGEAWLPELSLD